MSFSDDRDSTIEATSDAAHQVRALLDRHEFANVKCVVVHFAYEDPESFIGAFDGDGQLTPLIRFAPLPLDGRSLLRIIAEIDENGPRLVANYRRMFSVDVDNLEAFDAGLTVSDSSALAWLIAACSLALGLEDDDAARALESLRDAVTLDTTVFRDDVGYWLDSRCLLRSLMSYRIGGVPTYVLARSLFTSMGVFVAESVVKLIPSWPSAAVVCTGDLFVGNDLLREVTSENLRHLGLPILFPAHALLPVGEKSANQLRVLAGSRPVPVTLGVRP